MEGKCKLHMLDFGALVAVTLLESLGPIVFPKFLAPIKAIPFVLVAKASEEPINYRD